MKKIILLSFLFFLFSCNKDIEIIESKDNSECRKLATCFGEINNHGETETFFYSHAIPKYVIDNPYNIKILEKTKTLNLINKSQTKVYEVRIMKTNANDKVSFVDYTIEPTQEICLGCNSDVTLKIGDTIYQYPVSDRTETLTKYEGRISNVKKCDYKIHSVKMISEY